MRRAILIGIAVVAVIALAVLWSQGMLGNAPTP